MKSELKIVGFHYFNFDIISAIFLPFSLFPRKPFHKNKLFSLYNITCMYAFSADHLEADRKLVCSSLEKTTSQAPSCFQFPTVLSVG